LNFDALLTKNTIDKIFIQLALTALIGLLDRRRLPTDRFPRLTGRGLRLHFNVTLFASLTIELDGRLPGCRLNHRIRYGRPRLGRLEAKQEESHYRPSQQAADSPDNLFHVSSPDFRYFRYLSMIIHHTPLLYHL